MDVKGGAAAGELLLQHGARGLQVVPGRGALGLSSCCCRSELGGCNGARVRRRRDSWVVRRRAGRGRQQLVAGAGCGGVWAWAGAAVEQWRGLLAQAVGHGGSMGPVRGPGTGGEQGMGQLDVEVKNAGEACCLKG